MLAQRARACQRDGKTLRIPLARSPRGDEGHQPRLQSPGDSVETVSDRSWGHSQSPGDLICIAIVDVGKNEEPELPREQDFWLAGQDRRRAQNQGLETALVSCSRTQQPQPAAEPGNALGALGAAGRLPWPLTLHVKRPSTPATPLGPHLISRTADPRRLAGAALPFAVGDALDCGRAPSRALSSPPITTQSVVTSTMHTVNERAITPRTT